MGNGTVATPYNSSLKDEYALLEYRCCDAEYNLRFRSSHLTKDKNDTITNRLLIEAKTAKPNSP
jgi:hypothetical protein